MRLFIRYINRILAVPWPIFISSLQFHFFYKDMNSKKEQVA